MFTALDLRPSLDDSPGVSFAPTKIVKLKESKPARYASTDTESSFNDTFREFPSVREQRLREAAPWQFERGVPTNGKTSSRNYKDGDGNVKIIDGEHKTLLALGKISEAVDSDDHDSHIYQHRLQLADPKLSETQRMGLMEHISQHVKQRGAKIKAVQKEAKARERQDISKNKGYGHGVGMLSRALPANTDDVIPQDAPVDSERKRTAGNMSMESRESRIRRFQREAGRISDRRRSL